MLRRLSQYAQLACLWLSLISPAAVAKDQDVSVIPFVKLFPMETSGGSAAPGGGTGVTGPPGAKVHVASLTVSAFPGAVCQVFFLPSANPRRGYCAHRQAVGSYSVCWKLS